MRRLERLCRRLEYQFENIELLQEALTHRSAAGAHNERLEFLGDAILSLIVSEALFQRFPRATEGQLSRLRASLVKGDTLAVLARDKELGDYLSLGPGELKSGGFRRDSILADALEAVIGAIYLDGGMDAARPLVLGMLQERLDAASLKRNLKDPKTRLQEYLQSRKMALPKYTVLSTEGDPHEQTFRVTCRVDALGKISEGEGLSRRRAEQAAAEQLLQALDDE